MYESSVCVADTPVKVILVPYWCHQKLVANKHPLSAIVDPDVLTNVLSLEDVLDIIRTNVYLPHTNNYFKQLVSGTDEFVHSFKYTDIHEQILNQYYREVCPVRASEFITYQVEQFTETDRERYQLVLTRGRDGIYYILICMSKGFPSIILGDAIHQQALSDEVSDLMLTVMPLSEFAQQRICSLALGQY